MLLRTAAVTIATSLLFFAMCQPSTSLKETEDDIVYYPPGTHDHQAKRDYKDIGLHFVGHGLSRGWMDKKVFRGTNQTLQDCIDRCQEVRKEWGQWWNGLVYVYDPRNYGECVCFGHEYHHWDRNCALHYRFEEHPITDAP